MPNRFGCQIALDSKLNLALFERSLDNYRDREVVDFLRYGWPINHQGEVDCCSDIPTINHKGATDYPEHIDQYISNGIQQGHIIGPFLESPFWLDVKISPLNTVAKRDSDERRVILDLSYPPGRSVNEGIDKSEYLGTHIELSFPSVDDFGKLIHEKGQGCLMYKRDLKAAYRQLNICPKDVRKLGFKWKGKIFMDRVVPMGVRSGAYICQRVTSAILYIFTRQGHTAVVYLDDFGGVESPAKAYEAYDALGLLLEALGVGESVPKACRPNIVMIFLGIWFNSYKMTMEVEPERLRNILVELGNWKQKTHTFRKEVESLIGVLSFAAKCVRPSRVFLSRMLDFMRSLPAQGKHPLSKEFLKDVEWWRVFMPQYNGISLIPSPHWSDIDGILATDACLTGCGGVNLMTHEYFHVQFPLHFQEQGWHINELELLGIMVAIKLWGAQLKGERLRMYCDNTVAVAAMRQARVRNPNLQKCMREITYWLSRYECELYTMHIQGSENRLPDLLSRWHLEARFSSMFFQATQGESWTVRTVTPEIFDFTAEWY